MTRRLRIATVTVVLCGGIGMALLRFGPAQWRETPPTPAELSTHWHQGVRWMREHEAQVLSDGNPMLWRMVREHLQRALMLYWTGAPERVKPVWMNRLLRAQRPDGGWDYAAPPYARWLWPVEPSRTVDFHATAQGLLVIALATAHLSR